MRDVERLANPTQVRLAELVASLSLATDLGLGQPMEHILRSCRLGLRIAEDVGLDESERAVVYYVALLAWLGCHADSYEQAAWFGDDIGLRQDKHAADAVGAAMAGFVLRHVGCGEDPWQRARLLASLPAILTPISTPTPSHARRAQPAG